MKGGAREGAGRKPAPPLLKKTARSVKLPEWLWQWIDAQEDTNRGVLIENNIKKCNKGARDHERAIRTSEEKT
jgi:hypothetical protein